MTLLKKIAVCIGFCLISIYFSYVISWYVSAKIGSFTFACFSKYLITQFTLLDINLMNWFPILTTVFLLGQKNFKIKAIIKLNLMMFLSLIISFLLGISFALIFWNSDLATAQWLPEYIIYQPFEHHWTIFISLGIVFPIVINILQENKKLKPK